MINLLDYVTPDRIISVNSDKRLEILKQLIAVTLQEEPQHLHDTVFNEITTLSRKKEISLGEGFGLAHARIDSDGPIRFGAALLGRTIKYRKGDRVHTIFCLVVPDTKSRMYLSLMARLTRMLASPDAPKVFRNADPEEIMEFVRAFEGHVDATV